MLEDADKLGLAITSSLDRRVTPIGRVIRRFKIDDLPQVWNVLRGEMSLVGPRPEVPHYVETYSPEQRRVLTVRPGLTDPASSAFRREQELLATQTAPDRYYRDVVLPDKLKEIWDTWTGSRFPTTCVCCCSRRLACLVRNCP